MKPKGLRSRRHVAVAVTVLALGLFTYRVPTKYEGFGNPAGPQMMLMWSGIVLGVGLLTARTLQLIQGRFRSESVSISAKMHLLVLAWFGLPLVTLVRGDAPDSLALLQLLLFAGAILALTYVPTFYALTLEAGYGTTTLAIAAWLGVLASLIAITALIWGPFEFWGLFIGDIEFQPRASGWFVNGNRLGAAVGLGAVALLALAALDARPSFWRSFGFASCLFGLMLSGSRSALVATAIAACTTVWVVARRNSARHVWTRLRFLLMPALGLAVVTVPALGPQDLIGRFVDLNDYRTVSGRSDVWTRVWDTYASSTPTEALLGLGFRSDFSLIGPDAHSSYLSGLINYGVLWLACYIALFLAVIVRSYRSYVCGNEQALAPLIAMIFVFFIGFSTMTVLTYSYEFVVFLAGLSFGLVPTVVGAQSSDDSSSLVTA